MQKVRRIWNTVRWPIIAVLTMVLAILFGTLVILGLGSGLWMSSWWWLFSGLFALVLLKFIYSVTTRKILRKLSVVYVLIVFSAAMPVFAVHQAAAYQSIAQGLTSSREINHFRNILGRSYNYTELIQWENRSLSWNSSSSMAVYNDPIEIYEHHQARCHGYAVLYAELCISQGYQCRIVVNIFGDHVWNEVRIEDKWTRIDASPTGAPLSQNIGYPLFYEEKWHAPPILALAFEGLSIVDVTSSYRSDHWSLLSMLTIVFVSIGVGFVVCIYVIWKKLSVGDTIMDAVRGTTTRMLKSDTYSYSSETVKARMYVSKFPFWGRNNGANVEIVHRSPCLGFLIGEKLLY